MIDSLTKLFPYYGIHTGNIFDSQNTVFAHCKFKLRGKIRSWSSWFKILINPLGIKCFPIFVTLSHRKYAKCKARRQLVTLFSTNFTFCYCLVFDNSKNFKLYQIFEEKEELCVRLPLVTWVAFDHGSWIKWCVLQRVIIMCNSCINCNNWKSMDIN